MFATFTIKPPANASEGTLRAMVSVDGRDYSFARERIAYPHIGLHVLMPPAEAKIVRADIRKKGELIGYIPGAGDEIPQSLEQIGYNVKMLECGRYHRGKSQAFRRRRARHSRLQHAGANRELATGVARLCESRAAWSWSNTTRRPT